MSTLPNPLSNVVDVAVQVSAQLPVTPTFNQGLVIGTSAVIPSVTGPNPRLRQYSSLVQMLTAGFTTTSPEYIAMSIYFGQNTNGPAPQSGWVGRQDLTALQTVIPNAANEGLNYVVGDVVTVVQVGGSLGTAKVTTIGAGGAVTGLLVIEGEQGTGYAIATGLATTGGSGTGLEVDITAIGETPLQAISACRLASTAWYAAVVLTATDSDSIAIGEWAQAITPASMYMYTTSSAASLNGTTGNVLSTLKAGSYNRALGIYSTTQSGSAPNNIYAAVAVMGVAMGLNTGLANSFYTLKFKSLVGIVTEPLDPPQQSNIEGNNGNLYLNYADSYNWVEQGVVANGQFFDEIINLDMLATDYQFSVVDLLVSNNSAPLDDSGQSQILGAVDGANQRAAVRGFLAGGTWRGVTILNLTAGNALPNGYLSQSPAYSTLTQAQLDARQAAPVYVAIIEAGAIHSVMIGVYVQR